MALKTIGSTGQGGGGPFGGRGPANTLAEADTTFTTGARTPAGGLAGAAFDKMIF